MRSRGDVPTGSAGSSPRGPRWAVVSFSEAKRVFDTGNVKKIVGDADGGLKGRRIAPTAASGTAGEIWAVDQLIRRARATVPSANRSSSRGAKSTGVKGAEGTGLPTASDLDRVEEEKRVKWLTRGKSS